MKLVEIGFTRTCSRPRVAGGCVVVGKTALNCKGFVNELPRSTWLPAKFTVEQLEVRTCFSEVIASLFKRSTRCRKTRVFFGLYESDGWFEPLGGVPFDCGQFFLDPLPLAHDTIAPAGVLVQREALGFVEVSEPLQPPLDVR